MDQQQNPVGTPETSGSPAPTGAPAPRMEPIGETWASGVGPTRLGGRTSRFRWAIALGVVLVVAMVTVASAFVLSGAGGSAKSLTAGNAPKNAVMFVDLRTDLPGDQHQKLADFMSHFPGFKDRAQFDSAFEEMLNKITGSISPEFTYTSAFKGWATGEVSIVVTSLGSGSMSALVPTSSVTMTSPSGALIVALKDRAAGEKWVSDEIARTGNKFTAEDYAGTKVYVSQATGVKAAYAFTDKVLVAGDEQTVKAALDAPAKGSLADSSNYQDAMHSFSGDSVASFYMDYRALMSNVMSSMPASLASLGLTTAGIPAWMAGSVRAESDHMLVEMTTPKMSGGSSMANSQSVIAEDLPGSTVGVYEIHSVGALLTASLKSLGSTSSTAASVKQIDDALAMIGGIDWIGDTDMVVTKTGTAFSGGVVVKTKDASTATGKKVMITNLVSLIGSGSGITSKEETYKGATITLYTAPASATGGVPVSIGIATKGDLLVAGYSDDFIKAMLDTTASNSLASQSDYKAVMSAAGSSNSMYGYLNIAALANEIGQSFSGNAAYYNLNYKPYVDHIGGAGFASVTGNTDTFRFVVTAK
jgi:hypothetical protein